MAQRRDHTPDRPRLVPIDEGYDVADDVRGTESRDIDGTIAENLFEKGAHVPPILVPRHLIRTVCALQMLLERLDQRVGRHLLLTLHPMLLSGQIGQEEHLNYVECRQG